MTLRFFIGRIVDTFGRHETWKWAEARVTLQDVLNLEHARLRITTFQFSPRDQGLATFFRQFPTVRYETHEYGSHWEPHTAILSCDPVFFQAELLAAGWVKEVIGEWVSYRR
jgi:hypothetical protein